MEALLGLVLSAAALGVLLTWPRWGLSPRMRRDQLGPALPLPEAQHGSVVTLSGHLEVAEPLAGPTEADVDRMASAEGKTARGTTTEQGWGGASHAAWSLAHGEAATAVCSQGAAGLALCTGAARLPLEGQVEVVLGSRESRLASPRPRRRGRAGATFVRSLAPGDLVRVEARLAPDGVARVRGALSPDPFRVVPLEELVRGGEWTDDLVRRWCEGR